MRAKEYLMQIRGMEERIKTLKVSVDSLYEIATNTTQSYDKDIIDRSITDESIGAVETNYADAVDKLRQAEADLLAIQTEVIGTIHKLTNNNYATLLMRYYAQGMTWEMVANTMHYSRQRIDQMHGQALMEIQRIIDKH